MSDESPALTVRHVSLVTCHREAYKKTPAYAGANRGREQRRSAAKLVRYLFLPISYPAAPPIARPAIAPAKLPVSAAPARLPTTAPVTAPISELDVFDIHAPSARQSAPAPRNLKDPFIFIVLLFQPQKKPRLTPGVNRGGMELCSVPVLSTCCASMYDFQ